MTSAEEYVRRFCRLPLHHSGPHDLTQTRPYEIGDCGYKTPYAIRPVPERYKFEGGNGCIMYPAEKVILLEELAIAESTSVQEEYEAETKGIARASHMCYEANHLDAFRLLIAEVKIRKGEIQAMQSKEEPV
jgi:hypothetical protein